MFIESTDGGIAFTGPTAYHGRHGSGLVVSKEEFDRVVAAVKNGDLDNVDVLPIPPMDPEYIAPDIYIEV